MKLVEKELEDNYRECPKSEWHLRQWNHQTLFNYVLEHWTRGQDADRRSSANADEFSGKKLSKPKVEEVLESNLLNMLKSG